MDKFHALSGIVTNRIAKAFAIPGVRAALILSVFVSALGSAQSMAGAAQVQNTPLSSAYREFTQDNGPGMPSSQPKSSGQTFNIGQTAGPSISGNVFNLPQSPVTNYAPPGGGGSTSPGNGSVSKGGISLGSGGTAGPVRVCADGYVDADGRPIIGYSVGQQYEWDGSNFIPDYAAYSGILVQNSVPTTSANISNLQSVYNASDSFNWVTSFNALNTSWGPVSNDGSGYTFWSSIQINTNQTIAYLQAGPNGNCGSLLNACLSDSASTAINPNTISTDITQIGGADCVNYYQNCQVSKLLQQSGNSIMTSTAAPEGTTPGGCQVFSTAPTCSQVLPLFQKYAPDFSCSCDSTNQNTPFCMVYCPYIQTAWQVDAGPTQTCSCASSSALGAPTCTSNCLGQLPGVQQAKGSGYTCTCSPNSSNNAPNCQQNCGGLLPTFQAQYPNYTCSCPSGTAIVTNPVCVPTCQALAANQQAALGGNYTCSCQDPTSTTEQPSCPMNCGGYMATNTAYQTNANQICSCPSGNNSITTPTCVSTCGSQLSSLSCPSGQVATCPNGNTNAGTPQCVQQTCGSLQSTWSCPTGNVATCPNGTSALSNPVCQQTCGSQLTGFSCPAGQVASCPNGNSNPGTPTCTQQTCGTLQPNWSCQSGYVATCPNGTSSASNPVCAATCATQLSSLTCSAGSLATCTAGSNSTTAPTCVQQSCGSLLSSWTCSGGVTPTCPNGTSSLSNPSCTPPTCSQLSQSLSCQSGYIPYCSSTYATPTCQPSCYTQLNMSPYAGGAYYCSGAYGFPVAITSSSYITNVGGNNCSPSSFGKIVYVTDPYGCGINKVICGVWGGWYGWLNYVTVSGGLYTGAPVSSCVTNNYWNYPMYWNNGYKTSYGDSCIYGAVYNGTNSAGAMQMIVRLNSNQVGYGCP